MVQAMDFGAVNGCRTITAAGKYRAAWSKRREPTGEPRPGRGAAHRRARDDIRVDGVSGGGEGAGEGGAGVQYPHMGTGGQGCSAYHGPGVVKRDDQAVLLAYPPAPYSPSTSSRRWLNKSRFTATCPC